jgi:ornithine cyclodeaminase
MLILDADQTREALPFDRLIENLRRMFAAGCEVPRRHVHRVETAAGSGTVLIMPAWNQRYLGIKTVNIYPGNGAKGLPGLSSVYTLFDAATGVALAHLDGNVITARRTAAASALAASCLARKDAKCHLVIGAGQVGRLLPQAYRAVFPGLQVEIWNRHAAAAVSLAEALNRSGFSAGAVTGDLAAAVARADIISTATLSQEPIVKGGWLRAGSHLDLIGSFTPEMREADDTAFESAALFVDTNEALDKRGELLGPMSRGVFAPADVASTLAGLCAGLHPGRTSGTQRTVFKSVGTALEDLAAAIQAYEHWRAA